MVRPLRESTDPRHRPDWVLDHLRRHPISNNFPSLYLGRLLTGGFASAIVPSVLALVTDLERCHRRRARGFGWVSAASSIGLLAGPILGGVAADWSASIF